MCGLVGMFGQPLATDRKVLETMLLFDLVRGEDATGVLSVDGNGTPTTSKMACKSYEFLDAKPWGAHDTDNSVLLMGHNRAGTQGRSTDPNNAHPFHHGSIVLAHNGTLRDRDLAGDEKFGTDSEGVAWHINEHGIESAWKGLNGAACLTWYNTEDSTFNFIRNAERPFWFVRAKDGSKIYYASEAWMVERALSMFDIEHGGAHKPNEHFHFSLSFDHKTNMVSEVTSKLDFFTPPTYRTTAAHGPGTTGKKFQIVGKGAQGIKTGFWKTVLYKSISKLPDEPVFPGCVSCGEQVFPNSHVVDLGCGLQLCGWCSNKHSKTPIINLQIKDAA